MMTARSYRDLEVWQAAVAAAKQVYRITTGFPKAEQFGLCMQLRRSAVSVASNIAEGAARRGTPEFVQFLHVSLGSLSELDTQLEIARDVVPAQSKALTRLQDDIHHIRMMLHGLIRSLKRRQAAD